MSLLVPPMTGLVEETNLTAADRNGTTITAGATANTKGAFSAGQLLAATAAPAYGLYLEVSGISTGVTATSYLLDIGIGPSGSEVLLIPDINVGYAALLASNVTSAQRYFFPVYIPSGERIAARGAAEIASDTAEVAIWVRESPQAPLVQPVGTVLAYGVVAASSRGTLVPSGTNVYGAWTQIPASTTTSEAHRWWTVGLAQGDLTIAPAVPLLVDIGFGPSDPPTIIRDAIPVVSSSNEFVHGFAPLPFYAEVPSGEQLWARIAGSTTDNFDVIIYGMS